MKTIEEINEKELAIKRKKNMKLYSIHRMLTVDLLFYYAIKFMFLTQIKGISPSDIVLGAAFFGIAKAIFQIPTVILIDKLGNKKSLVLSDLVSALSIVFIMLSPNAIAFIISNSLSGCAFAVKDVSENGLLNDSVPNTENRTKIFSKIDARGLEKFYVMSAISAIISGFLYDINGYIPMCICVSVLLISTLIAVNFYELKPVKKRESMSKICFKEAKEYFKNLRYGFSFVFRSRRLKALMLFGGVMFGIISVLNIYEMGLLEEIKVSSVTVGIIYASMQLVAAVSAKIQGFIHEKFKNKTLTFIGLTYVIACVIAGAICLLNINYMAMVAIVVLTYVVRYLDTGSFQIFIKKYMTNFTNEEVQSKVYSAYGIVSGIGSTIIGVIGSIIVAKYNLKMSLLIFGIIFTVVICIILQFMRNRVGLKPEEYRKKDIDYKEYMSLK